MPFGASPTGDGETRFRLWAPGARSVELLIGAGTDPAAVPMQALSDGWFDRTVPAGPGTRYRFRVDGGLAVPDPASRFNPEDVHGASEVVDPGAFDWQDEGWPGRPWEEAVVYELHVGTFSPEGTFAGVERRLDYLADLGVTAIELMPVADFPGRCNWGYDGVLPFAPDASYGRPEDLKRLVQAAHARGLMVLLDVVYNHFGPEGNYLHVFARDAFFTERHHTPWGAAINFDGPGSGPGAPLLRRQRALLDRGIPLRRAPARRGARHLATTRATHVLEEIAAGVRDGPGRERQVHLVLENDANQSRFLARDAERPAALVHGAVERRHPPCPACDPHRGADGYYADYAAAPRRISGAASPRASPTRARPRPIAGARHAASASAHLPPGAFVGFLQNHDQVGNRAFGERLAARSPRRRP